MNIDNMSFGSTTTDTTLRRTEVERTSVLKKLSGVYDAEQKMVFLFDVSGSMSERIAKSYENQYVWTDAIVKTGD